MRRTPCYCCRYAVEMQKSGNSNKVAPSTRLNFMELSKADKKAARILIDKGIAKDFEKILIESEALLAEWRAGATPGGDLYGKLYRHIIASDKQIARKYDGITGSRYFFVLAIQLAEGLIEVDDIKTLSDGVQQRLRFLLG